MRRAVLVLFLTACGGGSSVTEPPPENPPVTPPGNPPGLAASIAVVGGADQRAEVGKELAQAIVVHVTDAQALAIPSQIVNFVVVSGGGSVFSGGGSVGTGQTNAQGDARERWTLGTVAGEQVLEARAVDQATGDPIVFAKVTATADPGAVATLTLSKSETTLKVGEALDVASLVSAAADQYGNAIATPAIAITADKPFTVQGTLVSSAAEGSGSVTVTSGSAAGSIQLTVLRNLADLVGARGNWACLGRKSSFIDGRGDVVIVREEENFIVDSVVAPGPNGTVATMWATSTITLRLDDGASLSFKPALSGMVVSLQEPGRVRFASSNDWTSVTNDSPLTYVGGAVCRDFHPLDSVEPITITKE